MNLADLSISEKERMKNKAITELYNSGEIQSKVDGMCFRNGIKKDTFIAEDVVQETFMHLSRKSADEILEMYFDNPKRLVGLCVTIAKWKGFAKHPAHQDYPKHSLANFILFASNLNHFGFLSTTDAGNETDEDYELNLVDEESTESSDDKMWEVLKENLDEEDLDSLNYFLTIKKKQGRFKKEVKDKYIRLVNSIKRIVNEQGLNVPSPINKGYRRESLKALERKEQYIMTQTQIFENIQQLVPALKTEFLARDKHDMLRDTYNHILPGTQMDLTCPTCVKHYLNILLSYYEREYPKFEKRMKDVDASSTDPVPQNKSKKGKGKANGSRHSSL